MLLTLAAGFVLVATSAFADFRIERRLALEPGGAFALDSSIGSVTIAGDSPSGVTVTVTSRRDDFDELYDMRFDESAGRASVTVTRRGGWLKGLGFWNGEWFGYTQFVVHVPSKTTVTIKTSGGSIDASHLMGKLGVHSSGGSLRIEDTEGDVDGSTSGGSIRMRDVRGNVVASTSGGSVDIVGVMGRLRATTSGGSVDIDTVGGDLYASTSGGSVNIRGAGGRVDAHSSGGPVTARFNAGNNRGGELSSSGGSLRAEIDPSVPLTIDASSSGGRVYSELPVTVQGGQSQNALRGDLNGGGAILRMRSSGGGVRIAGAARTASR
jgi:hypothetical protein